MAMTAAGSKKIICEINITPLTDIFLVLLIIMMIVAPVLNQSTQDIAPPAITSGDTLDPNRLTMEVTAEGDYFINGDAITTDGMAERMRQLAPTLEAKDVIIRADKQTKSRFIMKIFEAAQVAGYEKVVVAGESLSEERAATLNQQAEMMPPASTNPSTGRLRGGSTTDGNSPLPYDGDFENY